jgi:hypothetical protein
METQPPTTDDLGFISRSMDADGFVAVDAPDLATCFRSLPLLLIFSIKYAPKQPYVPLI